MLSILFRYYGARRLAAIAAALPLAVMARWVSAGAPPADFYTWPYPAQRAAAHLVAGGSAAAYGAWLAAVACFLVYVAPIKWHAWLRITGATAFAFGAAPGAWLLVKAAGALSASPPGMAPQVFGAAFWALGPAIAIGLAPLGVIELIEYSRSITPLQNLLHSGRGPHATWAPVYKLKEDTSPIPEKLP